MRIWLNLIRKEWLEHQWKLASMLAIMLAVLTTLIADDPHAVASGYFIFSLGYAMVAPLFFALRVASAESAGGTMSHVRALPIASWKPAVVRNLTGAVILLIPLIIGWAGCRVMVDVIPDQLPDRSLIPLNWDAATSLLWWLGVAAVICLNLYFWCIAVTMNMHSEIHAAIVCVAVIVAISVLGFTSGARWDNNLPAVHWPSVAASGVGPVWPFLAMDGLSLPERYPGRYPPMDERVIPVLMMVQLLTLVTLFWITARRYGRDAGLSLPKFTIERTSTRGTALGPPLAGPRKSLLWQRWQEASPLGFACLGIVLVLSLLIPGDRHRIAGRLVDVSPYFFVSAWIGCMLALYLGVISFTLDLEPKLHTFWRSRPINPAHWFRMKYAAGLLILLLCLHLPSLLILSLFGGPYKFSPSAYLCIMLLHMMIYGIGVLSACAARHSLYSMIFAVGGTLAVFLAPVVLDPVHGYTFAAWTEDVGHNGFIAGIQIFGLTPLLLGLPYLAISILAPLVAGALLHRDVSLSYG